MAGMIRAQARRIGVGLLAAPVVCGITVAVAGIMVSGVWSRTQTLTVVNWLAQLMVIGSGVCVAVALTGDPLVEASESTPVGWRRVESTRFVLTALSGLVGAVLMFAPLHVLGLWPQDMGWASLIAPAGAVLVVGAAGFAAAAWSMSTQATVMAVVAVWMFLALLWDPYVLDPVAQRGIPFAAAVIAIGVAWRLLGDEERNATLARRSI
ncbi:hypothetical protein CS006_06715 [Bifidobacterium primatium]|uniref:Uncharacterized protein n=1 Tax=Bifidobacterium primatium TaxID=2045438 RepID=A0A2M9H806_9BIFI|nr:hypothetical protein [Bifidobacterium primatium]PJM72945.1 hypothetical protein CS006_06715 [Bifidobacterium primatium]